MTKNQYDDSPFYAVDSGNITGEKQINIKITKNMYDILKNHFQERYADDIKVNGFKMGKCVRNLFDDYIQNHAFERKQTQYSIFAMMDLSRINESNALFDNTTLTYEEIELEDLFIKQSRFFTESRKTSMNYTTYSINYSNFDTIKTDFTEQEQKIINTQFLNYKKFSGEDIVLLEIPLNNFLDTKTGGFYCFEGDFHWHHGAIILTTDYGAFGLHYSWMYNQDEFFVEGLEIISQTEMLDMLKTCQNNEVREMFATLYKTNNKLYPQHEVEMLKYKRARLKSEMNNLNSEIDDIDAQIEELEQNK